MAKNSESIEVDFIVDENGVTEDVRNRTKVHPTHIGVDYAGEGKDFSALTVKIDVDVSDALKGLKAVQREAKKTAKLLKEIEQTKDFNPVINITMNGNENPEKFIKELRKQMDKLNTTY